jgi:tight adherence protein C
MPAGALITVFWVFLLTFGACATLYLAIDRGGRPTERRLQDLAVKFRITEGSYDEHSSGQGSAAGNLLEWAHRRLPEPNVDKPAVEKIVNNLQYAGFTHPAAPKVFLAIRLVATALGVGLGYLAAQVIGGSAIVLAAFSGGLCYIAPTYVIRSMAKSRQIKIRRELPDVIDLLVVCVECGLGLMAAIRVVGREAESQDRLLGAQLNQVSAELAAGATLADGLRGVAQRTGVEDLKTLAAILVQSEKLGTEMAQALRATADQMRMKRTMRAEEMAQKLPVKMIFPLVLFLLPATMIILTGPPMIMFLRVFSSR